MIPTLAPFAGLMCFTAGLLLASWVIGVWQEERYRRHRGRR